MVTSIPNCPCGRKHETTVKELVTGKGALSHLPALAARYGAQKPFILADTHTYAVCGESVRAMFPNAVVHIYDSEHLPPDNNTVGSAFMHFDRTCDLVIAIGSGVINDTCKIVSHVAKLPYIIVATAPSMDGYASDTSSMERDGFKISIPSKTPDIIIGDTDLLKTAPDRMLRSGLGDMLAKYISICEWRIDHIVTGEYYCEKVASQVRDALHRCVENADGLIARDDRAIEAVFEGLVLGGMAMQFAGFSRPASGIEHYFSHIWDMRALAFGTPCDLHGIQCAVGTLYAARGYEQLLRMTPDREKARNFVKNFDVPAWHDTLRKLIGPAAETMIADEFREERYSVEKHEKRLDNIINNWDEIKKIVLEEVPTAAEIESILDTIGAPKTCTDLGQDASLLQTIFKATRDIRSKYILSQLAWDMGVLDEIKV